MSVSSERLCIALKSSISDTLKLLSTGVCSYTLLQWVRTDGEAVATFFFACMPYSNIYRPAGMYILVPAGMYILEYVYTAVRCMYVRT